MQKEEFLINEAAKVVHVESHVLRYWEEELDMPIQRNEKGHRVYTQEDLERFMKVKELKEEGLQLKAVKKILQENDNQNISFKIRSLDDFVKSNTTDKVSQIVRGKMEVVPNKPMENKTAISRKENTKKKLALSQNAQVMEMQQEKMVRMQALIKKFITDTVVETHEKVKETLKQDIKENIAKEIDYQFRARAELEEQLYQNRMDREDIRMRSLQEQEEKWEKDRQKREEDHYKNIDELLRKSLKSKRMGFESKENIECNETEEPILIEDDSSYGKEKRLHEKLFSGKRKKLSN